MRTLWAILLGGLALVGTATATDAKLGQTLEEVKARHGSLEEKDNGSYPNDLADYEPITFYEGFDLITYTFFKRGVHKKCIAVIYIKIYESREAVDMGLKEGEEIIAKNFPDSKERPKLLKDFSDNLENAGRTEGSFSAGYGTGRGLREQSAFIAVEEVEDSKGKWAYSVICHSREFGRFSEKEIREGR